LGITTQKILRLTFKDASGRSSSITLPQPREDLTSAEIEAAMDLVIARNIFTTSGGDLIEKYDIKIVDTTTNDLFDSAEA
jgi:hypothetical protein